MQKLSEVLPKIKLREYTPEQLERARQIVAERNSICAPDCPECGGVGWVRVDFGKYQPCPNVDPLKLYPGSKYGLEDNERGIDWPLIVDRGEIQKAAVAVRDALGAGYGWVYLWGAPGLGKTLTLKIAVAAWLRSKRAGAYTRMASILDDLRSAFDAQNPSEESQNRLDWWAGLPLLAIDEFDRVRSTEYANERRFMLMDLRYEQAIREKSITLMASNENPANFEGYLSDRIRDGRFTVIELKGKSFRPGAL